MSETFAKIKYSDNKKYPFFKIEGNIDALKLKMGVDYDELEKFIKPKSRKNRR